MLFSKLQSFSKVVGTSIISGNQKAKYNKSHLSATSRFRQLPMHVLLLLDGYLFLWRFWILGCIVTGLYSYVQWLYKLDMKHWLPSWYDNMFLSAIPTQSHINISYVLYLHRNYRSCVCLRNPRYSQVVDFPNFQHINN
jgi:hypothetical protein